MGLSLELFKACCASVSKITTFASLDPLLGVPSQNALLYLKQHNITYEEIRSVYREAMQKGSYMLELALLESEGVEENILIPFIEEHNEDKRSFRQRAVTLCQKLRSDEVVEELVNALEDSHIEKALQEMSSSKAVFAAPDAFLFYLNKISGWDTSDNVFVFLIGKGFLFHSVDYQLKYLLFNDNRLKNIAGISSYSKMKLRLNLTAKNINDRQKQKAQLDTSKKQEILVLESEIAEYQNCLKKMTEYVESQKDTLDLLNSLLSTIEQQIGHEIMEKVKELSIFQGRVKKDTSEIGNVLEEVEEVTRLTKQSMEILGDDRIEFSHNLMGPVLENQRAKIDKSRSLFEKIPNTHSQKAMLANRLGVILNALGLPDKAAEYFRRALVLLPASSRQERAPIESNLFYALLNKGSFDAALKYMMESLEAGSEECNLFDVERYIPKKILGVGGMGVTFLCEDVYEERLAVVKTLWRYTTGGLKEVFSEAFTAKKIDDPRIIKIYDIGRHRANRPFIVMEYCPGVDLQQYISEVRKGEPLNVTEALKIMKEVAQGLTVAHTQNPPIIHRDIKPTNILYTPDQGSVKIIDFGIACMLPDPEQISRSITRSSGSVIAKNIAGTWGYMAPEQQRGEQELTAKSDIFSLGKTLMFLLTGKTPPPENIFALKPEARNQVGELVGYCLMPHAQERYSAEQVFQKAVEIMASKGSAPARIPQAEVSEDFLELPDAIVQEKVSFEENWNGSAADEMQAMEAIAADEGEDSMSLENASSESNDDAHFEKAAEEAISEISLMEEPSPLPEAKRPENKVVPAVPSLPTSPSLGGEDEIQSLFDSQESSPSDHAPASEVPESLDLGDSLVIEPGEEPHEEAQEDKALEAMDFAQSDFLDPEGAPSTESTDANSMPTEENTEEPMSSNVSYELTDFQAAPMPSPSPEGGLLKPASLPKIELPKGYLWEGDLIVCEKDGATMVYVPAGSFSMGYEGPDGSFAEAPVHEVTLDGYLIDQCPVTWYQYSLFCKETAHKMPMEVSWDKDESQPVVHVSYEDASAYAQWAGKFLPTEAQWEKAAKGGFYFDGNTMQDQKNLLPDRRYAWGNILPNQGEEWLANCAGEPLYGQRSPSPVGLFTYGASPYGCLDMSGNVWEWCQDWFNDTYYQSCPNTNPRGPKTGTGRVLRGGAWNSEFDKITTTFRSWMEPDEWWNIIGFRTVRAISKI